MKLLQNIVCFHVTESVTVDYGHEDRQLRLSAVQQKVRTCSTQHRDSIRELLFFYPRSARDKKGYIDLWNHKLLYVNELAVSLTSCRTTRYQKIEARAL
jgi:hypothetical protein